MTILVIVDHTGIVVGVCVQAAQLWIVEINESNGVPSTYVTNVNVIITKLVVIILPSLKSGALVSV